MSAVRIFKFGGSSVADADRLRHVAALVADEVAKAGNAPAPVVVVSALQGVTDTLVRIAGAGEVADEVTALVDALRARHHAVLAGLGHDAGVAAEVDALLDGLRERTGARGTTDESPDARSDRVRAVGEDLSARLLVHALRGAGLAATLVDARRVVRTDARFGQALPDAAAIADAAAHELAPVVAAGHVAVVQGFVGSAPDGRTTTLGRGGSDFTATLLGAALDADEVHIWTDVDGVLSADPRVVGAPRHLEVMGFEETVELAHFGAKVLHPGAAKHAVAHGLTVRVRSTFAPERPGSLILRDRWGTARIAAVAFKPEVALIRVRSHPSAMPYGFLARVFEVLTRHELPVDLVATSHTSTAFTLDEREEIRPAARELEAFADVIVTEGLATVTVVGHGLMQEPGLNARVFAAVGHTPVHLVSQASDVSLSLVVDRAEAEGLVQRLHHELVEGAVAPILPEHAT